MRHAVLCCAGRRSAASTPPPTLGPLSCWTCTMRCECACWLVSGQCACSTWSVCHTAARVVHLHDMQQGVLGKLCDSCRHGCAHCSNKGERRWCLLLQRGFHTQVLQPAPQQEDHPYLPQASRRGEGLACCCCWLWQGAAPAAEATVRRGLLCSWPAAHAAERSLFWDSPGRQLAVVRTQPGVHTMSRDITKAQAALRLTHTTAGWLLCAGRREPDG